MKLFLEKHRPTLERITSEYIKKIKQHKEYHSADARGYFYEIRKVAPKDLPELERAARFIYLNRTCFNGLYRVNSKGQFNVPIGSYKNPSICNEEDLREISKLLQKEDVRVTQFYNAVKEAKKGDHIGIKVSEKVRPNDSVLLVK